ncbi:MAG: 5-bromo-4-chloroindolyl phosphate hydrolysis family protein [Clostridia bacterium]|nr:5-bromo-4-chloroindolyl phosphate hydrolysis family protein [Clostridia bacterium]
MNGTQKNKTITHPTAMPYYAAGAIFLVWALITPIYKFAFFLIGISLSAAAWLLAKRFFPGRVETITVEEYSGDEEMDRQIKSARELMARIALISKETPDEAIREALASINASAERIIEDVVRDATGRNDAYTFFSYYLPTLDKLLSFYTADVGAGENALKSKARIKNSLSMVASAFEKQADNMYKNEAMDIKTDIAVMETMLRSEGLIDKNTTKSV